MKLRILPLVLVLGAAAAAQEDTMEARLEAKLQKDFVKHADWITDYDKARATAKEKGKLIFAYFTRSYAP